MADFNIALKKTLRYEGGYVDDPTDAGGETYRGISRRYNPGWDGWKTIDKMKSSTDFPDNLEKVKDLHNNVSKYYKTHYWDKFRGDEINDQNVANELFDTGVNMGIGRAVKYLQEGLNLLNRNEKLFKDIVEDGAFGPNTLQALKTFLESDDSEVLLKIMNILQGMHYIDYMKKSPVQEKYARGWFKRVEINKK